jgi:hypothetical protein
MSRGKCRTSIFRGGKKRKRREVTKGGGMLRSRLKYAYNFTSLIGMVLAITGAGLIVVFLGFEAIRGFVNPYTGIMVYFVFPVLLVTGLLLIPIGMWRERKRIAIAVQPELPPYPVLNLNDPHKRHVFIFFIIATIIFVLIISIASIRGFEFTESPTFCGKVCHTVMKPEYTTWSNSPHARVKCVECHVGSGAKWYVKTKIAGLRMVYGVATHTYPIPIETPVTNLRPARDTCEHCHWPEKFYSGQQKNFYHYASDEKNTPREIILLLKIGGTPLMPTARGIHWHVSSRVEYQPRDRTRQDIPYIRVQEKDGRVTEYMDTEKPLPKSELSKEKQRLMDCIDCHNRPTHIFLSPSVEMDDYFVSGHIDRTLPYIKKTAVDILSKHYETRDEADAAIAKGIKEFYAEKYPALNAEKAAAINKAVAAIQGIYAKNFFPRMKTAWYTHPDNLGHFYFPGCFRCHDGKHKSSDGRVISKDCNLCHHVIRQIQENIPPGTRVTSFVHPMDIGDELEKTNCSECHMAAETQ